MIDERPVVERQRFTEDRITMKVKEEKIEVMDNEKLMVTIPKEKSEEPRKAWAFYDVGISKQHYFIIEFEDGRLVNYVIDEPLSRYEKKWDIKTNQAKKIEDHKKMVSLGEKDTRTRLRPPVNDDGMMNDLPDNYDPNEKPMPASEPSSDEEPYPDEKEANLPGQDEFPDEDEPVDLPNEDGDSSSDTTSSEDRKPEDLPEVTEQPGGQPFDEATEPKHPKQDTTAPSDVAPAQATDGVLPVEVTEHNDKPAPTDQIEPKQPEPSPPQPAAGKSEETHPKLVEKENEEEAPAESPKKSAGHLAREPDEEDLEAKGDSDKPAKGKDNGQ